MVWDKVIMGGANLVFGSIGRANEEEARVKANDAAYKQYLAGWRYNKEKIKQTNKYNTKVYENQIANDNIFRQYDYDTRNQQRDYQMSIRDYEFGQSMRMFNQQVRQRDQQLSFNQRALNTAIEQQNIAKEEGLISLGFQDFQNNMDIKNYLSGTQRKLNMKGAEQRSLRSQAAFESEKNIVAGLEAQGAARASGRAGRSAAKEVQAVIAKNAMQEAAIAEGITQAGDQYALSVNEIVAGMNQAFEQFYVDRQAIELSRQSFLKADKATRKKIEQDYQQANMNAFNAVMLRPEIMPALPEVMMQPATVFTEPVKLSQPDHLKRGDFGGNSTQGNSFLAGASDFFGGGGAEGIGQLLGNLIP